ncbi:MAG: alpha/beta fold hydrolase [Cyanobacteria bacterium J083]|nr:MAG: alpha/beta fold hydrolase [Cyanobacteria bacterium J083]
MQSSSTIPSSVISNYWQWRGYSIYHVQAGKQKNGKPPLLLVHGFGASTDHWRKNIAQLQTEYQVWAIDLLGFGRSTKADIQYSGAIWCAQLHDFITEVIGQPVILVGNSLGGYASLCVAAQHPESAVGVVLINSAGPFTDTQAPTKRPVKNLLGKLTRSVLLQPLISYFLFQYLRRPAVIRKTLEKVYLNKTAIDDYLVESIYRPSCEPGAVKVFASVFKSPAGEKVDTLLRQLQCPLMTIWGEADPWMNSRQRGAKFRQYYPNLTEHYVQAGHCPHDEIPETVNNLLNTWISNRYQF